MDWDPWAQWKYVLEEQCHRCVDMTEKRILLEGPMGRYWYLGERVWRQVKGNINAAAVPMAPPESMRHANFLQGRDLIKAIRGKDAVDFIVPDGNYESFCRRYLMPPRVVGVPPVGVSTYSTLCMLYKCFLADYVQLFSGTASSWSPFHSGFDLGYVRGACG